MQLLRSELKLPVRDDWFEIGREEAMVLDLDGGAKLCGVMSFSRTKAREQGNLQTPVPKVYSSLITNWWGDLSFMT